MLVKMCNAQRARRVVELESITRATNRLKA